MATMIARLKDLRIRKDIRGNPLLSEEKYREYLKQGYKPDSRMAIEIDDETDMMYQ